LAYRDSTPPPPAGGFRGPTSGPSAPSGAAPPAAGPPRPFALPGAGPPGFSGPPAGGYGGPPRPFGGGFSGPPPGGPPGGGDRGPPGGPRGRPGDDRPTEPRVNRRIRVREVRVIGDDGSQLGILTTDDALRRAEEKGLDLVEVQPMSRPPVCKIMDYGKYKYEQKRKAAEMKKKQKVVEVKEIKFRPKTGEHDYETKVRHAREFVGEGDKVKVTIMFRGREIVHPEIGQDILKRVAENMSDIAQVELAARMEGKAMFMIMAPGKAPPRRVATPMPIAGVSSTSTRGAAARRWAGGVSRCRASQTWHLSF
jgi:translation initiation factor IF-3